MDYCKGEACRYVIRANQIAKYSDQDAAASLQEHCNTCKYNPLAKEVLSRSISPLTERLVFIH